MKFITSCCLFLDSIDWCLNFIIVARIAYDHLAAESPATLKQANSLLTAFSDSTTTSEGDYPFVECATWADLIKYKGGGW